MEDKKLRRELKKTREQLEMYRLIFDSIYNGSMVTDAKGFITHFNRPYGHFLGLNPAEQIGKHCTEAIENSRMHIVAKTGKPEINRSHRIKGQKMVVQRIPIKKEGQVIAVFGQVMFKDVRDVGKLAKNLSLLESKVKLYEEELFNLRSTKYTFDSIIGHGKTIKSLKKEALIASTNQFPVLISGESGTGKELFAQAIHHASLRKLYPFVRINCAAIPKDLLESELFGYEKGAFTGARAGGKPGKFELAQKGTIFLDEIGDLPLEMQPKLLRVLEEKEFERVGGNKLIRSDFRLIAATNQNLEEMVDSGRFRKDLFYRLNVIPIHITPLRKRRSDIVLLARYLLKNLAQEATMSGIRLDKSTEAILREADWPGNVRELSNVLERALSALEGHTIQVKDLPLYLSRGRQQTIQNNQSSIKEAQAAAEREAILFALEETNYNKAKAAGLLGIHRTLLYKKMKKYSIALQPD
ncbi:MAG: sigma 54-interacting transcriptional regulator [Thermodesulfobacteriota bacterium]|nr:sigma 54-interacting transcriptional regulator [Thermodesulfobacteriota bacterium]